MSHIIDTYAYNVHVFQKLQSFLHSQKPVPTQKISRETNLRKAYSQTKIPYVFNIKSNPRNLEACQRNYIRQFAESY